MKKLTDPMELHALLDRQDIWLASQQRDAEPQGLATGYPQLDQKLAQGGWPRTGVVELLGDGLEGLGELLEPLLSARAEPDRWLFCVGAPVTPYAPGLAPELLPSLICVDTPCHKERLWALEQSLASGRCALALAWLESLSATEARRLQLAAEQGQSLLLLVLPDNLAGDPHPVPLRLRLAPARQGCHLTLLKQRGGWPQAPFELPLPQRPTVKSATSPTLVQGPWSS